MIMCIGWMILLMWSYWINPTGLSYVSQSAEESADKWMIQDDLTDSSGNQQAVSQGIRSGSAVSFSLFSRLAYPFVQVNVSFSKTKVHNVHTFYKSILTLWLLMIHWSKPATQPTHIKRMLNQTLSSDGKRQICGHF